MMEEDRKIVFLFSGQGSQYRRMGQSLFTQHAVFRDCMEQAERIVQKQLNRSLIHELYFEKQPAFDDLLITHPAIVAIEIAMYRVLEAMNILPDYIAGNSLGEFAAAVAAGVWKAETAIEAALEQARSIARDDIAGGMLAVLHQRTASMEELYTKHGIYLASDNFNEHFTLSGAVHHLNLFQLELARLGIRFLRLPVAFPFHSPLIEEAKFGFNYYMSCIPSLENAKPGFVSGVMAEELMVLPENYFWNSVSRYINFQQTIRYIENKGPCIYIDLGPSGTAATFAKYNLSSSSCSTTIQIMTPYKNEEQQLDVLRKLMGFSPIAAA